MHDYLRLKRRRSPKIRNEKYGKEATRGHVLHFWLSLRSQRDVLEGVPDLVEKRDYIGPVELPIWVGGPALHRQFELRYKMRTSYSEFIYAWRDVTGLVSATSTKYEVQTKVHTVMYRKYLTLFSVSEIYGDT
jgi:hypothetical protein